MVQLLIVALLAITVLLLNFSSSSILGNWKPNSVTAGSDHPIAANSATASTLVRYGSPNQPQPAAIKENFLSAEQFDISFFDGLYTDERVAFKDDLQNALNYVIERFGSHPRERFTVVVVLDDTCNLRGIAFPEKRNVQVATCNDIPRSRAVTILAHEFVHQLAYDRYGPESQNADQILLEGVATWAAGSYWRGNQPDFRSYVRNQQASGTFYPLQSDYIRIGGNSMDALYYEWASFVEYLKTQPQGSERFDKLYVTGNGGPGTADYKGVYGKDFHTLEQEWRKWLNE